MKAKRHYQTTQPLAPELVETLRVWRKKYSLTELSAKLGSSTETIRKAAKGDPVSRTTRRILELALKPLLNTQRKGAPEFQEALRFWRTQYTLPELSKLVGLSTATLRKAEKGDPVSPATWRALERALKQMEKRRKRVA